MAIAETLEKYLNERQVSYDIVNHAKTGSSLRSATVAHVPAHRVAKAVILEDDGGYLMAVLPAHRHVHLGTLSKCLGRKLGLATEDETRAIFPDCAVGAIPPVGEAYGLATVVDDELAEEPEIFFESGDHEELIHMKTYDFMQLLPNAQHERFAAPT
ncbi:MAG TPA: YbaK/EbsC family protein [Pelomicrobium sp.]|nr:YbaK/EbsC family protein [Pelomicrobium sp.]